MKPAIRGIRDVAESRLCLGCGTCAYLQPDAIRMVDDLTQGRRPLVEVGSGGKDLPTQEALQACPGVRLEHEFRRPDKPVDELLSAWGPVLEVWEGHAADPSVRYAASSGGAATALALHCIAEEGMHGVLHITAREDVPYLNRTVLSRSRAEVIAAVGSRYAPASPCDGLDLVEDAPAPCVFIGKPCDVAGAQRARRQRPALDRNLGLTIGIFCAGTPSAQGTLEMLRMMGIHDPRDVASVRYRGNGWPGKAEARTRSGQTHHLSYDESWGKILQKHRQWRCYLCADHTGEFADIAVGDPWYRQLAPDEAGRSLVVVRTQRGREILRRAMESGAIDLERVDPKLLPASQPDLLVTRGRVWGRIVTSRMMGVAVPRYRNLATFPTWWRHLSKPQKAQSFYRTIKRILTRRLFRRTNVEPYSPSCRVDPPGERRSSR